LAEQTYGVNRFPSFSQDLCNPQDSGEVEILMAGKQECKQKEVFSLTVFHLTSRSPTYREYRSQQGRKEGTQHAF
jgi:hypothetical protein